MYGYKSIRSVIVPWPETSPSTGRRRPEFLSGSFGCRSGSGTTMLPVLRGWQLLEVQWEGRSGITGSISWTR